MKNQPVLIELLENRKMMSRGVASEAFVNDAVASATSVGLRPAEVDGPVLRIAQRTMYFNAVRGTSQSQELRITNAGTGRVTLTGDAFRFTGGSRTRFAIAGYDSETGLSIRAGRTVKFVITFAARGSDNLDIKTAALRVQTNVARGRVELRALPTAGIGGANEPSLQKVINLFNLPIRTGDSDPEEYLYDGQAPSDEVVVQRLQKAGPGAVSIRPLAMFGNDSNPAVRMGVYTPGVIDSFRPLWYAPGESAQSVAPIAYGQTSFDPGSKAFGIATQYPNFTNTDASTRYVYSEDKLNSWESIVSQQRKMRFFPFTDQFGNVVPNSYLVAQEEFTANYDNQDSVFIITNVRPAVSEPVLSWESFAALPNNNRLVFNKVEIPDVSVPNITRLQNTVRLRNTGTENLIVSISRSGPYTIDRGAGSNVIIPPGGQRDVVVRFIATGGSGVQTGTLVIDSNDADRPTVTIALAGYWQQYSEFLPTNRRSVEPTAAQIVNGVFGYTTKLTNPGQALSTSGAVRATGDEILSPYWRVADDNSQVRVQQLAAYHGQWFLGNDGVTVIPAQAFIGWHEKGNPDKTKVKTIFRHEKAVGQMILPLKSGREGSRGIFASGAFNPKDKAFGFLLENQEYSDPTLNADARERTGFGHFVRFWPAFDTEGKQIPNTYIMLHDYNRIFTNFDYQDNVYLISNVMPENAIKTPQVLFAEDTSRGARLSFAIPSTGPKIFGFNVRRSSEARGVYDLLTDTPLPRKPVTVFLDETASPGQSFYYQITSIGRRGVESAPVTIRV